MLRKDVIRPSPATKSSSDPKEIARFNALAEEWRKPDGKFKVVHGFNAARVDLLKQILQRATPDAPDQPLSGMRVIDVGCATGLVTEQLALAGARVVAIDAADASIAIARHHAKRATIEIDYRCALPEDLAATNHLFDAVVCLEVVEHVADVARFLKTLAKLVRPGGTLVLGTLNRTPLSWFLAIVAAEYALRWLPRGTHDWSRFVKPEETAALLAPLGLAEMDRHGVVFNPLNWRWQISRRTSVNYMQVFRRTA